MKNSELQKLLQRFPDEMPVKLIHDSNNYQAKVHELEEENILHTSETAHVNGDAPEDKWDTEDGRIDLGDGEQYLLINPIIT